MAQAAKYLFPHPRYINLELLGCKRDERDDAYASRCQSEPGAR